MKYFASVSYDGSKFYGFQRLDNYDTVQKELERALSVIDKKYVIIKGAGRTDRGVHAYGQGVCFELNGSVPTERLKDVINRILNDYVHVNYVEEVRDDFHPRFDAKKKEYEYVINLGEFDPIINDYVYNYNNKLNIKKMKKSSKAFIGFHSFKAFTSGYRDNYNSVIYKIKFKKNGDFLTITFIGKSFYRYMVRNMVGALIQAGNDKLNKDDIKMMLDKEKVNCKYNTAPACGLYLVNVYY